MAKDTINRITPRTPLSPLKIKNLRSASIQAASINM
jgi:hypothetical protein